MAREGNILEIIMSPELTKRFDQIDQFLGNIQAYSSRTADAVEKLAASFQNLGKAMDTSVTGSITNISTSADEAVNSINRVSQALNNAVEEATAKRKGSALDSFLFDTKELEEKKAMFKAALEELKNQIQVAGGKYFDVEQIFNSDSIRRKFSGIIEDLQKSIANTKQDLENTTKKFYSGQDVSDKEYQKMDAAYIRLTNKLETLKQKLKSAQDLSPLIESFNVLRNEYQQVTHDLNIFTVKNKKIQDAIAEIESYKKEVAGIDAAFKKLNAEGKAFDGSGRMTKEAAELAQRKQALEEEIKLRQMSADEAIKQEKRKNAEILADFTKLYNERLKLEQHLADIQNKKAGAKQEENPNYYASLEKAATEYKNKIESIDEKLKVLSQDHKEIGEVAKLAYDSKHTEQEIKNEVRLKQTLDKTAESQKKLNEENAKSKLGLPNEKAPQTIEEYRIAIKNLRAEIEKLNPADKAGIAKLNEQIKKYEAELQRAGVEQKNFGRQSQQLGMTLRQLGSAFGIVFSLQSLVNFGRKIVEITGYFEMQHRAMQALIQDTDAANQLWDKTVRLAVKSPYKIKELVSYTKQLSAYRIETSKLYETTKMLADISSGLGVDMQRLILAYGQVKAANYLRGQELRQFSEAGVNILGELANYFSELQGKAISTGEVFDMVSKRMVKFEDVSTVLRRLTEEGGIFFNMQEIQAETIQGQLANLQDSFDIFLNSIGEKKRDTIVNTIQALRDGLEDINTIMPAINAALIAMAIRFATVRIEATRTLALEKGWLAIFGKNIQAAIAGMVRMIAARKIENAQISVSLRLKKTEMEMERQLSAARAAGGSAMVGWATVIAAVAVGIGLLYSKLTATERKLKEISDDINGIAGNASRKVSDEIKNYDKLMKQLALTNSGSKARAELISKINSQYGEYLDFQVKDTTTAKELADAYGQVNERLKQKAAFEAYQQGLEKINSEFDKMIEKSETKLGDALMARIGTGEFVTTGGEKIEKTLSVTKDDVTAIEATIRKITDELNPSQFNEIAEQVDIINKAIRQYFGNGNLHFQWGKQGIQYFDAMVARAEKLEELQNTIDDKMGERTGVKAADQEIKKAREEMERTIALLRNANTFNSEDLILAVERDIEAARKRFAEQTIDIKVKYNIMSAENGAEEKKKLDAWATDTIKSINNKLFNLAPKYSMFDISRLLEINESRAGEGLDKIISQWKDSYESWAQTYDSLLRKKEAGIAIDQKEIENAKKMRDIYYDAGKVVGEDFMAKKSGGSSGNPALQLLNKQIEAIKNAAKQYEEYKKLYDDTTAFNKTKKAVQDLFGQLGIGGLLNKQGIFDKMTIQDQLTTWLSGQMAKAGKDGRIAIEKYVRELELQASQADFNKMVDSFKKNMEEAFSDYDMYKELEKLGIGKDFASLLFGVQTFDDKQLSQKFEQAKRHLLSIYDGEEAQKAVAEMQRKIDEAEDKAQKERLKKYVAYTKQAMTERARIEVEGLQEVAEIETTFQKEIAKAQNAGNTERASQIKQLMDAAVAGSKRATNEKLQKQAWEDFKGSDMYVEMFNDIGNASTKVINAIQDKITQLRGSLKDLNPSDLKAITQEITKLEDELIKRNPAKSYFDLFKKVRDLQKQGKGEDTLMQQMGANDTEIENLNKQIANYEILIEKRRQFNQEQISEEGEDNYLKTNQSLQSQVEQWKKLIDQKKKDNALTAEELATYKRFRNASQEFANYLQNMGGRVASIFSDIMSNLEAFGGETTNTTEAWGDLFTSITSVIATIPNYILLMKAAGVAANEALGVIGWIITAAELLMSLIKGIANIKNAQIDDEIEGYRKSVDGLSDAYDRLEQKFDSVWDIERLRRYNSEMKRNLEEQIDYYNKMINAEMTRKSPDQGVIDDYRKSIQDLRDDIASQGNSFLTEVGGLGTDSYKDAAQGFVDAWYDAFKETDDGLGGLRDNFNEILENMVKRQAVMQLTNAILKPLFKEIDTAAGDGTITNAEMEAINSLAESTFPTLNEKLKTFFQSLGMFGEQAEGELDGLQKGIQGVTEQTAEIIAAYMNAIRYYVIDNNTKLGQLIGIVQDNTGAVNPMLAELRSLRQRADDIHYLLNGWRETNGIDSMRVTIVN